MSAHKRNISDLSSSNPSKIRCVRSEKNCSMVSKDLVDFVGSDSVEVMETPGKSENDKKTYRVIRLRNGLKAILVSDPTSQAEDGAHETENKNHSAIVAAEEDEGIYCVKRLF